MIKALLLVWTAVISVAFAQDTEDYATMNIVLTQKFFDNLSQNFTAPLFGDLVNVKIGDLLNEHIAIEDLMSFDFNITDMAITRAEANGLMPIIQLGDNAATFQFDGVALEFGFNYALISDPPIFADIGSATLKIETLSFSLSWTSTFEDNFEL